MAIAVVDVQFTDGSDTTLTLPRLGGTDPAMEGEWLWLFTNCSGFSGEITPPPGWTTDDGQNLSGQRNLRSFRKQHEGASEPADYTITIQDTAGWTLIGIATTGVDQVTPINVVDSANSGGASTTSIDTPSIDPTVEDALLVFFGGGTGSTTYDPPAGFTEHADGDWGVVGTMQASSGDPTGVLSGTAGNAVITGAILWALNPAAGGGGGGVTATISNTPDIAFAPGSGFTYSLEPVFPVITRSITNTPDIAFGIDAPTWSLAPAVQYLRPILDSSIGDWTDQDGGTTDLWSTVDEASADTADYVKSGADPSNDTIRFKLTSSGIVDPNVSTDYIVEYQIGKIGTGTINLDVRVVQGASTEISAWAHVDIAAGPTPVTQTLTSVEADAITDHTDLYLEVTATTGQAYVFRDQFTGSIDSAWTITGVGSSVIDNELSLVGGTNWGDEVLKKTTGITRSAGRAMSALFIPEDREDSLAIGWQTGLGGADPTDDGHSILHGVGFGDGSSGGGGRMVSANGLKVEVHGGTHESRTIEQLATVVLRDAGAFYLLSNAHAQGANTVGSTDPVGIPQYPEARLLWVEDASSLTPLNPIISAKGTHGYTGGNRVDDYRVVDVAAWASDDVLAEVFDRVARADSNTAPGGEFVDQDGIYGVENEKIKFVSGGTWPHTVFRASADGKFRFRLTTPATLSDGFGVVLRQTDANNFLRLWNNFNATTLTLQSWVGGGFNATHVNYTVNWVASTEYQIAVDLSGDKIKVWVEGEDPSGNAGWVTCDVLTTGTGFGPFLGGADTRWNDLALYPHTVTLPAEIQDGAAPHIWTPGSILMQDTFTAADATALDGRTPDTPVGSNTWSTTATGFQISSNRLVNTNVNGVDNPRYALYDVGVSDVEITATFRTPASADQLRDGLILRANSDASDRIMVRALMDDVLQLGNDEVELWETIAASPNLNDFHKQNVSDYWVLDADHTFKVQIKDQLMHCFIDDEPIISYHLVGTHAGTYFGFAHSDLDDGISWDSITIKALS